MWTPAPRPLATGLKSTTAMTTATPAKVLSVQMFRIAEGPPSYSSASAARFVRMTLPQQRPSDQLRLMHLAELEMKDLLDGPEMADGVENLVHLECREIRELQACPDLLDLSRTSSLFSIRSKLRREVKRVHHQIPFPTCKHKLVRWDPGDLLEIGDRLDRRVSWDRKETMVIPDNQGPLDLWDQEVFLVSWGRKVSLDQTENQVHLDPKDHLESGGFLECPEYRVQRDIAAFLD